MKFGDRIYEEGAKDVERTVLKMLLHFAFKRDIPSWANVESFRNVITKQVEERSLLISGETLRGAFLNGADEAMADLFGVIDSPPSP